MYFRKSAQAGPALTAHEKPSPPPSAVPGVPLPPSIDGNGNQLSFEANCLSSVSGIIVGSSQSPCSSIAALPLATRPAELPAPCWAGVPRKPDWNGLVARNAFVSSPALTKHGSSSLMAFIAPLSVSVEHSRSAKYSHQKASGQRSLLPIAIGAMPADLSFATSPLSSSIVAGGASIPALSNRSLRYQNPTRWRSNGTPNCLP